MATLRGFESLKVTFTQEYYVGEKDPETAFQEASALVHDVIMRKVSEASQPVAYQEAQPLRHKSRDERSEWSFADDPRLHDILSRIEGNQGQKTQLEGFSYTPSVTPSGKRFLWRKAPLMRKRVQQTEMLALCLLMVCATALLCILLSPLTLQEWLQTRSRTGRD